jgi:outer membrane protein, multidrug efflux system
LILRARAANTDVRATVARVSQARAQLARTRASLFPTPSGSVTASSGDSEEEAAVVSAGVLNLAYEVDLFGRERARRQGAGARLAAAEFDRSAVALTVEAEVARAFVECAAIAEQIKLADRSLASARELKRVIDARVRLGSASRVDAGLQAIEVSRLEVERLRLVEAAERARNALAVLVGEEAPLFHLEPVSIASLRIASVAVEQPAELLLRRPDVAAAAARAAAAANDLEAARLSRRPGLLISAGGVLRPSEASKAAVLSVGQLLLSAVLDGGRLQADIDEADAARMGAMYAFRGVVLAALAETEDGLAAVEGSRERQRLADSALEGARMTARLSRLQYLEGYADLQAVSDAESRLIQTEELHLLATLERLQASIDLYRVMGGAPAGSDDLGST